MHQRINQRHLILFVEIVRKGSLAKAADELAITQSAASKSLRQLEQDVGDRLLERNRAGVTLTPSGEIFYRYASASLTALRQGIEMLAQSDQHARRAVLLGALPNVAVTILPKAVARFKTRYPDIQVRILTLTNRQLLMQLRLGEIDFVVGRFAEIEEMRGLHFERLYYETMVLAARPGHPLLQAGNHFKLEDIVAYSLVMPPPGTVIRPEIDRFFLSRGIAELPNVIETLSAEFARAYTTVSDALWIFPRGVLQADLDAGVLKELPVDLAGTEGAVGITTRSEPGLSHVSEEMLRLVREMCLRRALSLS
ncbi:MAG: pca operon transcription factor PcaQ [Pusillimonas sp.]|jgi:LysR family pca operon transcriptional activator|nr:pca operon transcription factor PcaQ [Pusillimonas sp.]